MSTQAETQDLDFRVVVGSFRQSYKATPHGTVWAIRPYDAQWGGGGADTCARFDVSTRQWSWGDAGELPFGRGEALKTAFFDAMAEMLFAPFQVSEEEEAEAQPFEMNPTVVRHLDQDDDFGDKANDGGGLHLRYLGADYDES